VKHVLLAAAIAAAVPLSADDAPPPGRILVMPFENIARDSQTAWFTEGAAVLLTDDLSALGAGAFTRDERREAFDRLQVPQVAGLTDATVIRIGQLVGASDVIVGSLHVENGVLVVHARSIALEAGRVTIDVTDRGELFGVFERIARRVAPALHASAAPAAGGPVHPPLGVFENYIKGLMAQTPSTAVRYLNAALAAQPGFDPATLALWEVYSDQGDHARALAVVEPVRADSAWSRRSRFLAGLSQLELKKYDDAFASFGAVAGRPPSAAAAFNNLGVVQLRRGWTPQTGKPAYYFTQAAEADPSEPDYCFNLGYAYWEERDAAAAVYWLRQAVRRNPADGEAHFVLGAALALSGNAPEAAREKELARRLSSTFAQWDGRPAADPVPKDLERVKRHVELPRMSRLEVTLAGNELRDQEELARFYLDRGRRLFEQENDREAILELDRAVYLSPYLADAHLLLGKVHLRNGRTHEAIAALKISIWSAETAEAHVLLAQAYLQSRDPAAARAEAERALVLAPASAEARRVLEQTK
jgi:tetratricopeptide (TPR) repeat protein/TolB-like protein